MTSFSEEKANNENLRDYIDKHFHFIRECSEYKMEYKSCKSLKGRFHQYFVDGETSDCSDLKKKWKSCKKCIMDYDDQGCKQVIDLEINLKNNRIKNHLANDVWTKRTHPPPDWNKDLPEWLNEKNKYNFLDLEDDSKCIIS